MREKGTLFSSIIAIVSLVFLGYVLFISIYDQMISQNEGFFYVAVFGGILVLAFILLSLMTKLMALSNEVNGGWIWYIIEIISFIAIVALFMVSRMSYKSSVPADESLFYRAAYIMSESSLANAGMDLVPQLLRKPAEFLLARIVSVLFLFFEAEQSLIVSTNTVLVILNLIFAYLTIRQVGGRICALLAAACTLFMPTQAFAVYTYDSQVLFSTFFFANMALYLGVIKERKGKLAKSVVFSVLSGFLSGILLCMEPAYIIVFIFISIYEICKVKKGWLMALVSFACAIMMFMILAFTSATSLSVDFSQVMEGYGNRFDITVDEDTDVEFGFKEIMSNFHGEIDSQDKQITDNYYFLSNKSGQTYSALQAAWYQLGNQLMYLFLMVLAVAGSFYLIRSGNSDIIPLYIVFLGSMFVLLFESSKDRNTFFFVEILIAIASCSLKYMYDNHHPELSRVDSFEVEDIISEIQEQSVPNVEDTVEEDDTEQFMERARALVFIGEDERLYREIVEKEKGQLRSPKERLPMPDISYNKGLTSESSRVNKEDDFSLSASFGQENADAPQLFKTGIVLPTLEELNEKTTMNRTIAPVNTGNKPADIKENKELKADKVLTENKDSNADAESYYFDDEDQIEDNNKERIKENNKENSKEENKQEFKPKKKVKLLDNPLPGPKKHVPKTLDYGRPDIKDEDYGYDYDIKGTDDFDY